MAATSFTPISLYYSSTASNVPTAGNLVAGELAINTADGKLFYKDSSNVVQVLATKGGVGTSSTTQVLYNNAGTIAGSANMIFDGTNLTTGGYKLFYNTGLYNIDGTLSNYASNNNVYLNGNAGSGLSLSSDGGLTNRINIYGSTGGNYTTFTTNNTERMRIDSSGNLLVGQTTSTSGAISGFTVNKVSANLLTVNVNHFNSAGGSAYMAFNYTGTQAGSITVSSTTSVLYNVTSDYRLKTVIAPVSNAGQRIDALEPIEYEWKKGGVRTKGFLAHKFAEIYPHSVSGEKDAVDEDGKPVYQGMQASSSEVMADLIAEIQSLRKRIATLESK